MKNQALFSLKDKSKKLKCRLPQFFFFAALRVNRKNHQLFTISPFTHVSMTSFLVVFFCNILEHTEVYITSSFRFCFKYFPLQMSIAEFSHTALFSISGATWRLAPEAISCINSITI